MANRLLPLDAEKTIKNLGAAQPGSGPGCPLSLALPRKSCTAHHPLQTIVRGVVSGASGRKKAPPLHPGTLSLLCYFITVIRENHFAPNHGSAMQPVVLSGFTQLKTLLRPHSALLLRETSLPTCGCSSDAAGPGSAWQRVRGVGRGLPLPPQGHAAPGPPSGWGRDRPREPRFDGNPSALAPLHGRRHGRHLHGWQGEGPRCPLPTRGGGAAPRSRLSSPHLGICVLA